MTQALPEQPEAFPAPYQPTGLISHILASPVIDRYKPQIISAVKHLSFADRFVLELEVATDSTSLPGALQEAVQVIDDREEARLDGDEQLMRNAAAQNMVWSKLADTMLGETEKQKEKHVPESRVQRRRHRNEQLARMLLLRMHGEHKVSEEVWRHLTDVVENGLESDLFHPHDDQVLEDIEQLKALLSASIVYVINDQTTLVENIMNIAGQDATIWNGVDLERVIQDVIGVAVTRGEDPADYIRRVNAEMTPEKDFKKCIQSRLAFFFIFESLREADHRQKSQLANLIHAYGESVGVLLETEAITTHLELRTRQFEADRVFTEAVQAANKLTASFDIVYPELALVRATVQDVADYRSMLLASNTLEDSFALTMHGDQWEDIVSSVRTALTDEFATAQAVSTEQSTQEPAYDAVALERAVIRAQEHVVVPLRQELLKEQNQTTLLLLGRTLSIFHRVAENIRIAKNGSSGREYFSRADIDQLFDQELYTNRLTEAITQLQKHANKCIELRDGAQKNSEFRTYQAVLDILAAVAVYIEDEESVSDTDIVSSVHDYFTSLTYGVTPQKDIDEAIRVFWKTFNAQPLEQIASAVDQAWSADTPFAAFPLAQRVVLLQGVTQTLEAAIPAIDEIVIPEELTENETDATLLEQMVSGLVVAYEVIVPRMIDELNHTMTLLTPDTQETVASEQLRQISNNMLKALAKRSGKEIVEEQNNTNANAEYIEHLIKATALRVQYEKVFIASLLDNLRFRAASRFGIVQGIGG